MAFVFVFSFSSVNASDITIRYAHYNNEFDTAHLVGEIFRDLVSMRTDGAIDVDIFPGTITRSPEEGLQFVQAGSIDVFVTSSGHIAGYYPDIQFLSMPYLFNNIRHYNVAHDSRPIREILEGAENELGVKILGMWSDHNGFAMSSLEPIESFEDAQGVRIRTMQNPLFIDMYNDFGMSPTPTDWGEVYTSLQTGLVEANDLGVYGQYLFNFDDVIGAMAITNHYWSQFVVTMNEDKFNSLSPEYQEIVEMSFEEAIKLGDQNLRAREDEFIERAKEQGFTVTYPDLDPFIEAAQATYEKYFENNPHWEEWYDAIQALDPVQARTAAEADNPDFWRD